MNTYHMRGTIQSTFFGVAQPRFKGTTSRIVLTPGTSSVGCPRMANPAVSLLSVGSDLAVTLSLLLCGVKCASTPLLGTLSSLTALGLDLHFPSTFDLPQLLHHRRCCR
jgi:hypothetical protein